jgi:hypothetical protein
MTSGNRKPVDDTTYEQYLGGNSDKVSSMRARSRSSDHLLIDYVGKHPLYVRRLGSDIANSTTYEQYLRGNTEKQSFLRDGNRPLDHLLVRYNGKHPHHIRRLSKDLPIYGDLLHGIALKETVLIQHTWDKVLEESVQYELSLSMFDFILSVYCDRVFQFLDHDKQAPLLLADALLFQVTEQDASTADEGDILHGRTHTIRGIHKFLLLSRIKRKQSFSIQADARSWLLGVEIAHVLCGGPDLSVEHQVMARTAVIRYDASAAVRLLLYNEPPSITKRTELEKEYERNLNNFGDIEKYSQKKFQGYGNTGSGIVPKLPSANKNTNRRSGN